LKASNGGTDLLPSSAALKNKPTKTVNIANGQLSVAHHLIHAEARKNNRRNLSEGNDNSQKMQNHQPVTNIAPKIAKEVHLRPMGMPTDNVDCVGLPTLPPYGRYNGNDIKSPAHQFSSPPPRIHSNSMIPERDSGPARLPASPPTITQATPSSATIVQPNYKPIPQRALLGPTNGVTVQSTPVKAQPALITSSLAGKVYVASSISAQGGVSNCNNVSKVDVKTNSNDVDNKPKHFHSQNPTNLPAPKPSHQPYGPINHPPVPHQFHAQQPQTGIQSGPQSVKAKATMNVNVTRTHHHNGSGSLDFHGFQKIQECHSSSDENRSSGHASMSDTGGGNGTSSPGSNKTGQLGPVPEDNGRLAAGVTSRNGRSRASTGKPRHRNAPLKNPWSGSGLEDIKTAIQQLTLRSQTSTSTYSSLSAGSESSEPARRLGRYSSMETVNTNVTSADEFVWVDSHNRLVELQHPPWSQYCLLRVIRVGRCREFADRVSAEAVPRLGYLLTRALVRVAREIQRLSSVLGLCSKNEVAGALKMVLCPALADSSIKACLRAAAMFYLSGDGTLKQTKSARAGLQLPVGRFHRWMVDARLGKFVHEYAAVYLCAAFENLLEEVLLQCMPTDSTATLTAMGLEHAIANSGDLWGLLQPFVHLNAGRIASGALTMPRWTSEASVNSNPNHHNNSKQEPCLLTTCVGSLGELKDLVNRSHKRSNHVTMSQAALRELFYFMRCSQLEHNEGMCVVGLYFLSVSCLFLSLMTTTKNKN
jgi:ankyrin repeat and BTB/POZ domain-containing protein 2